MKIKSSFIYVTQNLFILKLFDTFFFFLTICAAYDTLCPFSLNLDKTKNFQKALNKLRDVY